MAVDDYSDELYHRQSLALCTPQIFQVMKIANLTLFEKSGLFRLKINRGVVELVDLAHTNCASYNKY